MPPALYSCILSTCLLLNVAAGAEDRYEAAPIRYSESTPENAISRLQEQLDTQAARLEYDARLGYLPALLSLLKIPAESQTLVFSKTSFQSALISPETPRALYFNDDSYIGMVPGGEVLEVSTADAQLGAVFYTLAQEDSSAPRFVRRTQDCLQCHASSMTDETPGHILRSVYTDPQGFPILKLGTSIITQDSPWQERWGGWYVTGTHGNARHLGNIFAQEANGLPVLDREAGANTMSLPPHVSTARYLTPHSDLVALLVLEHQTQLHNLMTEAGFATRQALADQAVVDQLRPGETQPLSDSTRRRIASAGDRLLRYMLFVDEVELEDPVQGSTSFAQVFAAQGPRDAQGRSLREFDLKERLFKYPLSYLIYSEQFNSLPVPMKEYLYRQLFRILTGARDSKDYLHLTNAKCRAIREILLETKSDLPEYWKHGA